MEKNKIIVIGGGYAGLQAVEYLARDKHNEITLIDKNPYHYMQTEVYDFIANENDFSKITTDLFTYCAGFDGNVTFIKREVKSINFETKKVITHEERLSYDYLVIAVGSRTNFYKNIVGLKEFSYGIKALDRALFFKQKFEQSLFHKIEEEGTTCTPLNIIVAGGGLSGVEVAAQMASFSKEFYKRNHFLCRKLNIVIINAGKQILTGLHPSLVKNSIKRVEALDILIKNEKKVTEVTQNSVTLSDGEVMPMDFMIFVGGIEPNALIYNLNLDKTDRGYIQVKNTLQTAAYPEVFAIGDCATIYHGDRALAPTADVAEQMGHLCAKNISLLIEGKTPHSHRIKSRGILIALGRNYAVARVANFSFRGLFAYYFKKLVEKVYAQKLDHRSNKGWKKIFV